MALTKSGRDANLSAEELLERINALLPGIAARARQAEVDRRPHDETMRELVDADIMRMLVPKRFGGHEMGLATLTAVARMLSRSCMSTAWVTAFYLGHNWMLTKFPEPAQKEVFAEKSYTMTPIQPSPMLRIKQVPGGYEVDGRSSYSSGIMHADWVILAKSGGADARAFVVRKEDIEVDDVWHMSGMSATGSNDVIAHELFVPEHRTLDAATLFNTSASIHDNPLYRIPLLPFIYCEVMGVYVGGLEGATHAYEDIVRTKTRAHIGDRVAERQSTHVSLGQAHARLQAGNALLDRLVADTWALAEAGAFDIEKRLELKLRAGYINDLCRQSVNEMASMGGTSAFRQDSPLQRFFRDLNTLATHAFTDRHGAFELWGRQRLGLEPNSPLI
jgi:alkylation response protein AidB-like acyl-CoA dehydrogenase